VRRALAVSLATLVIYALALEITPIPVEGVEQAVSETSGRGAFVLQKIWVGYTFFGLAALILKIVHGTWFEENRLLRTIFNVSIVAGIVGLFLPWLIVAFYPPAQPMACVLRGWVGEILNAFC